ncbi:MAG: aminotransferase class III-fold pyridoxal phosphate-dependent enzyme [Saprospirales bacterium]|nr:aminotransferase class III-fold pyridoxal phosphate-dependent enzyme [Saprospirales bacterium]
MQYSDYQSLTISTAQASAYALQYFGIEAAAKTLPGEIDFNFFLETADGRAFTLKLSRPDAKLEEIDFQIALVAHLGEKNLPLHFPEVIPALDGSLRTKVVDENNKERWLRLLKWVPGRMLSDVHPRSPELLAQWGQTCGHLARALQDFDHPAAHRFQKWDPSQTLHGKQYRPYFQSDTEREIADHFWDLFETVALPALPTLRQRVNYNDAHEHNLLVDEDLKNPRIIGVIDFGDAVFTQTINELAIACAYACMDKPDPIEAATHVVKGFHQLFPLQEKEVGVLFPLIAARLLNTVSHSAWNKHHEPGNDYLLVSERPAWELLQKFRNISPAFAHYAFRQACGWEACPKHAAFQTWARQHQGQFAPVVDFEGKKVFPLDLSVGSLDLGNNANFASIPTFCRTIDRLLEDAGAEIGTGGYGEVRPFYVTEAYKVEGNSGPQWRAVHLGVDIWAPPGTPIFAPLDGVVHSFQDNANDCDYGPTIILEHAVSPELTFYSLYGHLSSESLIGLEKGMAIKKGQQIATIGAPPQNGNWPPHFHFQLMLDMLGWEGDFPGAAFPEERAVWMSICPDANLLLSGPLVSSIPAVRSVDEILDIRRQKLGKSLSVSYAKPLHIVRGYMQHLYDVNGRRYLDTVNNVPHVGNAHPDVVRVAQKQLAVLTTNTRYLHEQIVLFAEELLDTLPPELSVVYFVNSGSEANELALRMAEAYTGQRDMVAVEVGYHGNTSGCVAVSSYKFDGKGGKGAPPHTHIVPIPDTFRGLYRDAQGAGKKYADHVAEAVKKVRAQGRNIAGFICESIISCGGQIVLPEGYLKEAYRHIRAAGGLCIADEVQTGFGRVGDAFWGFELQGVLPDIVTMGKPIGNGHPLGAVVTTPEVAEAFANGMEYFNTFGGNPVSCAIGREVLRIVREEGLQAHAREVGAYLTEGLKELQQRHPLIGDVRGPGLFLGFELVKDRETLLPATEEAAYLANRMRELGILMSTDGPYNNVLKIKPPMCFGRSDVDFLVGYLDRVMGEDYLKGEGEKEKEL